MAVPRIVLTSGEPAGIGPDLCLAIAARDRPFELVVAADPALLAERAAALGIEVVLADYDRAAPARPHRGGQLKVLARKIAAPVSPGRLDPANAP